MTTTTTQLTGRQQEVLSLLAKGVKPPAIAKKLKISNSGVYGHMRLMRKAGVALPGEQLADSRVSPNGTSTPVKAAKSNFIADQQTIDALSGSLSSCRDAIAKTDAEMEQLDARRAELATDRKINQDAAQRYKAALEALGF